MTVDELKKIVDEAVEKGHGGAEVVFVADEAVVECEMRDVGLVRLESYSCPFIGTVLEIHG